MTLKEQAIYERLGATGALVGSTITAPGTAALYAGAAGDTVNFLLHVGGVTTPRAGGGTFNVT